MSGGIFSRSCPRANPAMAKPLGELEASLSYDL
jgi:hypothetical protein